MTMRITTGMVAATTLRDLTQDFSNLSALQDKLSSGKRITKPSDDPYGTSRALGLSGDLGGLQQYQRNVDDGTSWLSTSDTALSKISDVLQRARELLVQAGNDSAGAASRSAIADEIDQLTESVKQEANVEYAGQYVFSGTATTTPPYVQGGVDAYQGDAGAVTRAIGPGVQVQVNGDVSSLLGNGQAAGDSKLLDTLRDIADDLRNPNQTAGGANLRSTDIQRLDANMDTLNSLRADVGAKLNRLSLAGSRLQTLEGDTTQQLSNVQDADIAETITAYSTQQAAYDAALRAGANIVQSSLLDFLR
jgi:flagellar hook-associated protein 3 FlgL